LAGAAYALLMNDSVAESGHPQMELLVYDILLDLTLAHFPFSQRELLALSHELARQGPLWKNAYWKVAFGWQRSIPTRKRLSYGCKTTPMPPGCLRPSFIYVPTI
jgi:hypothetical protein